MNKNGIGLSLNAIIGLVLVAFIIIGTATFGAKLYAVVFPAKDASTKNFERLTANIQTLLNSTEMTKIVPYYIAEDYALVAFDKENKTEERCSGGWPYSKFVRLGECIGKVCLCLCKIEYPNKAKACVICKSFENVTSFFATSRFDKEDNNVGKEITGGRELVIFGQCYDKKFQIENLRIVKQKKNNKINIMFDLPD